MTLPDERTRAISSTREFLLRLIDPKSTRRIPRDIRRVAHALLRHYPTDLDLETPATSIAPLNLLFRVPWGRQWKM